MTLEPESLTSLLAQLRLLVARPENDFLWSGWEDTAEALRELDAAIAQVGAGEAPAALHGLLLPTGPLQELSLSSGWGNEFVRLAERIEAVLDAQRRDPEENPHER